MIMEHGYDAYKDEEEWWWWWWQIIIPACVNGRGNLRTQGPGDPITWGTWAQRPQTLGKISRENYVLSLSVWNDNMADLMWSTMTLWSHAFMSFSCTHGTFPQGHWKLNGSECRHPGRPYKIASSTWSNTPLHAGYLCLGLKLRPVGDLGTWKPTIKRLLCSASKKRSMAPGPWWPTSSSLSFAGGCHRKACVILDRHMMGQDLQLRHDLSVQKKLGTSSHH